MLVALTVALAGNSIAFAQAPAGVYQTAMTMPGHAPMHPAMMAGGPACYPMGPGMDPGGLGHMSPNGFGPGVGMVNYPHAGHHVPPGMHPGGHGPMVMPCDSCDTGDACGVGCDSEGECCEAPKHIKYHRHGICRGWYGFGEVLFLDRDRPNQQPITLNGLTGDILLTTDSIDYDYETGFRVGVGKALGNGYRIEGSYFGIEEWEESASVSDPEVDPITGFGALDSFFVQPFNGPPGSDIFQIPEEGNVFNAAATHTFSVETEIHNAELNFIKDAPRYGHLFASGLVGLRYFRVEEGFHFNSVAQIFDPDSLMLEDVSGRYLINAENDLIGAQVGGETGFFIHNHVLISVFGKGGFYANFAEQSSLISVNNQVIQSTTVEETALASILETGISGKVWLAPHISIYGGYNVVMVSGLALATDQIDYTVHPQQSQRDLRDSGSMILHGPNAGVSVRW